MDVSVRMWRRSMWGWALLGWLGACSEQASQDRRVEFEALLQEQNYAEVMARVAVYREAGERGASIDYAEGLAYLGENNDRLAAKRLALAAAADSSLAGSIADAYHAAAVSDHKNGWYDRAKNRMREAYRHNPSIPLEPCADTVADQLFRFEKDYEKAFPIYAKLIHKKGPAQSKIKEWNFRYGYCLEKMGFKDDALTKYRWYRQHWPTDEIFMRHVMSRLQRILITDSQAALERGDLDTAEELAHEVFGNWHLDHIQEARYLAGQVEERRQSPQDALDWYQQIIEDEPYGGEVVQLARTRLEALRGQGVH